jgi:hypothetical protein
MTREQTTKRDDLLIRFISKHQGNENGVSAQEIMEHMSENGFPITYNHLRNLVTKLKLERTLPICYKRGHGYFCAKTRKDIETTICDLESMVRSLQEHIEHLRRFIID